MRSRAHDARRFGPAFRGGHAISKTGNGPPEMLSQSCGLIRSPGGSDSERGAVLPDEEQPLAHVGVVATDAAIPRPDRLSLRRLRAVS